MRLLLVLVSAIGIAGGHGHAVASTIEAEPPRQSGQAVIPAEAQALEEFNQRIKLYSELHKRVESTLPPRPNEADPTAIDTHQRGLEKRLRAERRNAKQGDILTPAVRRLLRERLATVLEGKEGPGLKATIMDENPGKIALTVNSRYPDGVPVSTVPPQVLAVLPKLPEELEYRFIGNRLILLDVHANTVVDYMDNAFRL